MTDPIGTKKNDEHVGLGDLVHAIARPIAGAIDRIAGTRVAECKSCQQRRKQLNKLMTVKRRPFRGYNW